MLIDSHAHIYDHEFFRDDEAEEVLTRCYKNGINKIVLIGTNPTDSLEARDYVKKYDGKFGVNLYWTYGIHPEFANEDFAGAGYIKPDFSDCKPIAIGEVGLDYHYDAEQTDIEKNHELQKQLFRNMIDLAVENNLPLSFHVRDAIPDFLDIVDEYTDDYLAAKNYDLNDDPTENNRSRLRAVVHSYSDSKKNLAKCLARGFYIGVNGLATYSTLPTPPLERTLIETDAPFLVPAPFRTPHQDGDPVYGAIRNDSSYIKTIAEWLAAKHETTFAEVEKITNANCEKLFKF